MTDVERKLWRRLRCKQLPGHRFRRQVRSAPTSWTSRVWRRG